ncbi:MAG TPA: diacylglycerol kinase family protein [Ilumatobacteraceae bacterium]|nr:diacylglycerol kinase family protein [Ilumatobacteraceae bacterium]HRB01793.1 diacylglycerol kinase family protein [Ilumatobacteraceae bacterium]
MEPGNDPDLSDGTHIVAIWNPSSGSAPEESMLRDALGGAVELVETTKDDPGGGQTEHAVKNGAEIVVACGGDGTVRACLAPLSRTATALGIVPLGTGNLLAGNLGIPTGLDACEGVGHGAERHIDLGRVNGETFAVMAGSGFDALMIRDANKKLKSIIGTAAYVLSAAKNLRAARVFTRVAVDGDKWFEGRSTMVLVGNFGEVSAGLEVFPDAEPDDGKLDVAVMSASTVREWASILWRLVRGRPQRIDLARRTQGSSIVVEHDTPRPYELDGEDRDPTTRLEFSIEPGALIIHHASQPKGNAE